jgi:ribonuclease J
MGLGLNHTNTFLMDNGQVLEFKEGKGKVHTSPLDKIHVGDVLIDGLGVGDVRSEVIRQRQQLSQDGILIIGVTISRLLKKIVAGPDVQMRGFIFIKDAESFNRELQTLLNTEIQDFLVNRSTLPLEKYKEILIEKVLKLTKRLTGKTPVVMPILVNVDQRADASK